MKIKKSMLKRIIQEEMGKLSERVDPSTLEIDPEAMEFSVMAEPDREGEGGDPRRIKGRIDKYKGRFLPKAASGEEYFNPEYSGRQVSGMLSAQLRDTLNMEMTALGFDAAAVQAAQQRVGKSEVMGQALQSLLDVAARAKTKRDREAIKAAVAAIAGIKYGFSLPDMDFGEEA
tara:strand:+ start:249 stop:770 length:522 start_codon:yes stop_codon:yes gene_type:complete